MSYLKTAGIVIREVNTGEADKVITIFTKSNGRITAFAKGARKTRSSFSAGTQILSYNDYVLFPGKNMYSINSCETIESFYDIRNNMEKLTYAAHFIDIIDDTVQEDQPAQKVLRLLLNSLYMLAKTDKSSELIARIFEIRLLSITGYAPHVDDCIVCGNNEFENCFFSFQKCGFLCESETCESTDISALKISAGTVKTIRHIINSKMDCLFSFNSSPIVLIELGKLTKRYLRERLEKDYNKLNFLNSL